MRTCIECKQFKFFAGSPGYSEYTPGFDWNASCGKDHWRLDGNDYPTEDEYRRALLTARSCSDFSRFKVEILEMREQLAAVENKRMRLPKRSPERTALWQERQRLRKRLRKLSQGGT